MKQKSEIPLNGLKRRHIKLCKENFKTLLKDLKEGLKKVF